MNWMGGLVMTVMVAGLGATVVSIVQQERLGVDADPRRPWRWMLSTCVVGLVATIAAAVSSDWPVVSIGTVTSLALLVLLALAGSTGLLHRTRTPGRG